MDEYQRRAHITAIYPHTIPDELVPLWYTGLGLAGEAGEFCNKIKKIARDFDGQITPEMKRDLYHELGGVMWYLAEAATVMEAYLSDIAVGNLDQLASRANRGTLHGSGDDR